MVGIQGFTYAEKGAILQEFHPPATSVKNFTLASPLIAVSHVPQSDLSHSTSPFING